MHSQSVTVSVSIVASIQIGDTVMPEEPNSEASEKAATEARIATAVDFTNRAVNCMVANDKNEIESLITDLHKWQPCAVSLRKSGLLLIFYDVKVWEDAKVYDEASELRTKFSSIMKSAPISASAADGQTYFMMREIDSNGPLLRGIGSSSERNMWPPARLRELGSLL